MRIDVDGYKIKNEKMAKRGRGLGHVTYFSHFGIPNIPGTAEDTNLKFCIAGGRVGILNQK